MGMSREPCANSEERIVKIKGTPEQVNMVQHIIRVTVGEIMPGTPHSLHSRSQVQQQMQG